MNFWEPSCTGKKLLSNKAEYFVPFCKLIDRSPDGRRKCRQSDIVAVQEEKRIKQPYIYRCFAGFTEIAIPLVIEGEVKAVLITGQILARKPGKDMLEPVNNVASELGYYP